MIEIFPPERHIVLFENGEGLGNIFNDFGNWVTETFDRKEANQRNDEKAAEEANFVRLTQRFTREGQKYRKARELEKYGREMELYELQVALATLQKKPPPAKPIYKTGLEKMDSKGRDYLLREEYLRQNQYIISASGKYRFTMQDDGNAVIERDDGVTLWSTHTEGKGGTQFWVQGDGNLVVKTGAGDAWASYSENKGGSKLVMQDDGNLVLYTPNGVGIWATNTHNQEL